MHNTSFFDEDEFRIYFDPKSIKETLHLIDGMNGQVEANLYKSIRKNFLSVVRKKKTSGIDPEYLKKQKASLVRKHRQVIYLNDSEMAAISRYCEKFRVGTKTVLFREAIMEKVLSELDDNHPTLF